MLLIIISNFPSDIKPQEINDVDLSPKYGTTIKNVYFYDQNGKKIEFSSLIDYKVPIVLIPVYYTCDVVCSTTLLYTFEQLKNLNDLKIGKDYKIVAFSLTIKILLKMLK